VRLIRQPALLAAVSMSVVLLMYFFLVADRAFILLATPDLAAKGFGAGLLVLPVIRLWWMVHEWRLGTTVQRMSDALDREGRLPIHDGATLASGRLTDDAAQAVFEVARRGVEERPEDWGAWFHVAYAYEASRDRPMARKALRHAADLFRAERKGARPAPPAQGSAP
jgi:hypothetical protein